MAILPKPIRKVAKKKQSEFRSREKKEIPHKGERKIATKLMQKSYEGSEKGRRVKLKDFAPHKHSKNDLHIAAKHMQEHKR